MPKERKGDADVLRSLLSDAALKSEKYVCVERCQVRSSSARGRAPPPPAKRLWAAGRPHSAAGARGHSTRVDVSSCSRAV